MDVSLLPDDYSHKSSDYESLICRERNSREHTEKRAKHNVIKRIRRFARSQSQLRSNSRAVESHFVCDNIVNRTKGLYRDVKRRFSVFNSDIIDRKSNNTFGSHIKSLTSECIPPSNITRLRRYASDESLPTSESGCGSSVKTNSLSTDSNRSSICTVDEGNTCGSLFKGPFIGQGIALIDCTPCPYDKDALAFKKSDIINIIAKNDSGTWIGMANGKIGHFKFINIEEISSTCRKDSSVKCEKNESNDPGIISAQFEQLITNLLTNVNNYAMNDLQNVFEYIGLEMYDYVQLLEKKGFHSLNSLVGITDPSVLDVVGINHHDHQQIILSLASFIRKFNDMERLKSNMSMVNLKNNSNKVENYKLLHESNTSHLKNQNDETNMKTMNICALEKCNIEKDFKAAENNEENTAHGNYLCPKILDTNDLVRKLEHGYVNSKNIRETSLRKTISTSKSVFNLKYSENNSNDSHLQSTLTTKRRFKCFLNSDRKTLGIDDRRYNSINGLHLISKPTSSHLLNAIIEILRKENIDLTVEPYSDNSGFCGIPPALVQRYSEELEVDVCDIADTMDYIRLTSLVKKSGKQGVPNDFLGDTCCHSILDTANYENLHSWLTSIGFPMYENNLLENGWTSLEKVMEMREDDLLACGITKKRHIWSISAAIGVLNVNRKRIGKF